MTDNRVWMVLDMDDGILGAYSTKERAILEHAGQRDWLTIKVHRYSPGAYEVVWHYKGRPEDGGGFFLERSDQVASGGWEGLYERWRRDGRPMGRLAEPISV